MYHLVHHVVVGSVTSFPSVGPMLVSCSDQTLMIYPCWLVVSAAGSMISPVVPVDATAYLVVDSKQDLRHFEVEMQPVNLPGTVDLVGNSAKLLD